MHLIEFTKAGLYCRKADVYIDPWIPVQKALITHAHSDHARAGNNHYLAVEDSIPILKSRLGMDISCDSIKYGEIISINGVKISFHPAGHVIGSAQIRLEFKGEVWVISGDYKTVNDGITPPFESIKCTHFVTESTFGLPSYNWKPQVQIFDEINSWWHNNKDEGKYSVIAAYSLGKAQRVLKNINHEIAAVYVHPTIAKLNEVIRNMNYELPDTELIDYESKANFLPGSLLLAPPGALSGNWIKNLKSYEEGIVSGWMNTRGNRRNARLREVLYCRIMLIGRV